MAPRSALLLLGLVAGLLLPLPALRLQTGREEAPPKTATAPVVCRLLDDTCVSAGSRVVVVGDVHGAFDGLREVLLQAGVIADAKAAHCAWRSLGNESVTLVQMGDIVDRGPGATEAWTCLHRLQTSAPQGSAVVRLLGNHELFWLKGQVHARHRFADTAGKIAELNRRMKDDIASGRVLAAYALSVNGLDILFTHAGVRPAFDAYLRRQGINTASATAGFLNQVLNASASACIGKSTCRLDEDREVYEAGKDRGGKHIGGPFWTDFSILESAEAAGTALPGVLQIVGHTMAFCFDPSNPEYYPREDEYECALGLIRATERMTAICTDAGMYAGARAYLEISDWRKFTAFEKQRDGSWRGRDLVGGLCS